MNTNSILIVGVGLTSSLASMPWSPPHQFHEQSEENLTVENTETSPLTFGEGFNQQPVYNDSTQSTSATQLHSRLQIGGDYTYLRLKPHGHTTFKGNLGGAQGLYEYRPLDRFYGAAKLAWKQGNTHGSAGERSLLYIDVQERLGYTIGLQDEQSSLTLFSGFGYRHLGQKFDPKDGDSIHFRYNELYVPLGFIMEYGIHSWFHLGLGFTWMPQVFPTVSIVPLKGNHWNLTRTLNNYFVELPCIFSPLKNGRFLIIVNPFYERWEDGHTTAKSSIGTPLGVPRNTYNFWGVDLNLAYCF